MGDKNGNVILYRYPYAFARRENAHNSQCLQWFGENGGEGGI